MWLIDGDRVELSNLNRQILYTEADIGAAQGRGRGGAAARLQLGDRGRPRAPGGSRARRSIADFIAGADVVIDAADWPAHDIERWCNAACFEAGIPYITMSHFPPIARVGPLYVPGRTGCFVCQEAAYRRDYPLFDVAIEQRRGEANPGGDAGPGLRPDRRPGRDGGHAPADRPRRARRPSASPTSTTCARWRSNASRSCPSPTARSAGSCATTNLRRRRSTGRFGGVRRLAAPIALAALLRGAARRLRRFLVDQWRDCGRPARPAARRTPKAPPPLPAPRPSSCKTTASARRRLRATAVSCGEAQALTLAWQGRGVRRGAGRLPLRLHGRRLPLHRHRRRGRAGGRAAPARATRSPSSSPATKCARPSSLRRETRRDRRTAPARGTGATCGSMKATGIESRKTAEM